MYKPRKLTPKPHGYAGLGIAGAASTSAARPRASPTDTSRLCGALVLQPPLSSCLCHPAARRQQFYAQTQQVPAAGRLEINVYLGFVSLKLPVAELSVLRCVCRSIRKWLTGWLLVGLISSLINPHVSSSDTVMDDAISLSKLRVAHSRSGPDALQLHGPGNTLRPPTLQPHRPLADMIPQAAVLTTGVAVTRWASTPSLTTRFHP